MELAVAFDTLGLQAGVTPEEAKSAYKRLALKVHPDKPGGDTAKFQELSSAYERLQSHFNGGDNESVDDFQVDPELEAFMAWLFEAWMRRHGREFDREEHQRNLERREREAEARRVGRAEAAQAANARLEADMASGDLHSLRAALEDVANIGHASVVARARAARDKLKKHARREAKKDRSKDLKERETKGSARPSV